MKTSANIYKLIKMALSKVTIISKDRQITIFTYS